MPRPITRRPLDEPDEPAALREPLERDEPEALRALLALPFDLLVELRDPLLWLPFPPLAPIPLLLRFGMLILGVRDGEHARTLRAARMREIGASAR